MDRDYAGPGGTYRGENAASASIGASKPALDKADLSTLDRITARITNVTQYLGGMENALHAHADRVHGHRPSPPEDVRNRPERVAPAAALDRIWEALDALDLARETVSHAVERNITLA